MAGGGVLPANQAWYYYTVLSGIVPAKAIAKTGTIISTCSLYALVQVTIQ